MNFLSLPTELRVSIYQNLDLRSQAILEFTNKKLSSSIPTLERESMKRIFNIHLFDFKWEQETNPEIKQKIANYRSRLEKLVRQVILSEGKPDTINTLFSQIKSLREDFNTNVLEEKKMWDLFGGRDKFLQLPVIKLPRRLKTFYDHTQLKITPWDMGNNAIMRGTDHKGYEFFLLRGRLLIDDCPQSLRIQLIRFNGHKQHWEPLAVSAQVMLVNDANELGSEIQHSYLRELIQKGRCVYNPYNLPEQFQRLKIELVYSLSLSSTFWDDF